MPPCRKRAYPHVQHTLAIAASHARATQHSQSPGFIPEGVLFDPRRADHTAPVWRDREITDFYMITQSVLGNGLHGNVCAIHEMYLII